MSGQQVRSGLSITDVAIMGEKEALQRLELLSATSRVLDLALDDYGPALVEVAEICIVEFADLCAIEVIEPDGTIRSAAFRCTRANGLHLPDDWPPVGHLVAFDRRPVLAFESIDEPASAKQIRDRFGAQSLIVAPITGGGLTLGWLVVATGAYRRGFRPSALRIGAELSSRVGTAMQRVMLHREMQASAREQSRTVRRLRRLATAATNLAGAATTQSVLEIACLEACVIHEADGAIARWAKGDGSMVEAQAGEVNLEEAEVAFAAVANRRSGRGPGWVAYPLPHTDPWQQAALVVFVGLDFEADEELVLSSLASLVPIAFERALGTEAALTHEARLRAVVEASPVALIGLEPDGSVSMANRAAQELFSWPADPATWVLAGTLLDPLADLAEEVLKTETVVRRPATIDAKDLSLSGALLPSANGSDAPSVLVAGVDLSEIRRAERALVQAQRLDAMGQVAGRVAHDFNNLLTLIVGYAEILGRGMVDESQLGLVAKIEGASKRAATLTQQMLDMTRQKVDTGVVIDLGREITGLDAVLNRVAGPAVQLSVRVSHNVIKVRLDPSEMEQIVVNLVINACDAMEHQGVVSVSVELAAPPPDERRQLDLPPGPLALLTIADDGPGMSPEIQSRCLEPFFTTKDRGHGSGLGLPTVYGLVKERGGQLRIDSQIGQGTAIRIWLPICRDASLTAETEPGESWPRHRTLAGRVLLIEDDEDLRVMAERTLSTIGLDVVSASSAEEALALYHSEPTFSLLVSDIILPGLSGVDLVRRIRQSSPGMPVLYMTGYAGNGGRGGYPDQGDPVLHKPYSPDTLRLRVAELVRLSTVRATLN
jgi:signal transduction histidine kinase